ncbi:succinylglutamate desuccinylase/aspartoacylase family protein [Alloalcanivorax marinus]|uniref:succinylglutamate desuccinylase/aspartoacylase family protein n=1 Tax=Alloalcanivorax marinus TaxID=1177169 RepID=UPI0030845D54
MTPTLNRTLIALTLVALAAPVTANEREDEDGRHAAPPSADQAAPRPEDPDGPPAATDAPDDDTTEQAAPGDTRADPAAGEATGDTATEVPATPDPVAPLELLGKTVPVGTFDTLYWTPDQSFRSIATPVPVLVAHGTRPGPHLCLTAAVHGDELNGIEMVRRLMYELEPDELAGTVVGVPIVNLDGFRNGSRYLSDRRDLNRYFPGRKNGSAASRVAYSLFENIVRHCDYLVDLHTGSQKRVNQPQLRADLENPQVVAFAKHFGGMTVLHSPSSSGMLRAAAVDEGIVAVTMEAGGPNRLEDDAVDYGVQALETLLENLDMRKASRFWGAPQPVFYESEWIRAGQGGILLSEVELNEQVKKGQILGTVTDPISNTGSAIIAPYDGRVLGMAVNQVVHAGFAAYRIGEEKSAEEVEAKAEQAQEQNDSQSGGNQDEPTPAGEPDRPDGDTE